MTGFDPATRLEELGQAVSHVLEESRRLGASAAEAAAHTERGLAVTVRLGEVETIEHTNDNSLGITVYVGNRKGSASTADLSPSAIRETVEAACNIARYTQEDPCAGLADADRMASQIPDLDLYHPWDIGVDTAIEVARACETAARLHDARIVNSEGATLNTGSGIGVYANTHGFLAGYPSSRHSLSCAVVARERDTMERDYWYTTARAATLLEAAESVGRRAAERTVARLNARRLSTRRAPVLFRADIAPGLLRGFISAIRGSALYRKASFLLDHLGRPVFPDWVNIHENPLLPRGLASAPFDAEGVATRSRDLIRDGILQSYALDSYSARKLGLETTGNAGGVRNLAIDSGDLDFDGLLRTMNRGLVVTELMGQGVNPVTGDYSRGASGFWVENGEIQFPVEEITVAGNLKQVFLELVAVGTDTDHPSSIRTGSWLIEGMMIAGE
jgi:PmbA protein